MAEERLNLKQKKFINEYIKCGSMADAYMKIYKVKNRETARAAGSRLLSNVNVSEIKKLQLEKAGLTRDRIFGKIEELMEAKKVISANIYMKSGDLPAEEMKEAGGCTKDFIDVPDNQTQLNAAKLASQLSGALNKEDEDEQTIPVKLTFKIPKDWKPKEE